MSNIYDNWPGPNRNNYLVMTAPIQGENLLVNGVLLPSRWYDYNYPVGSDSMRIVFLPESNKDWCPFLGSIENLNKIFMKLCWDVLGMEDPCESVGIYFNAETEKASIVSCNTSLDLEFTDNSDVIHEWVRFDFSTSIQGLSRRLSNLSPEKPLGQLPFPEPWNNPGDWEWQGQGQAVSKEAYSWAKSQFESMYGTRLSDVKLKFK